MITGYHYKFYLNANHAIYLNGQLGQTHPHTWEFSFEVINENKDFVLFNKVSPLIDEMLNKYQNQNINNIEPFDKINPTLENISEYFMKEFRRELKKIGMTLIWIEVSENASISYFINVIDEKGEEKENKKRKIINEDMDSRIDDIIKLVTEK